MKRQFLFGTVMAAAMTVGLGAQYGTTPQGTTPQGTSTQGTSTHKGMSENNRGQMVTLVGCLQSSDQSTSGTSGTSTKAPSSTAGGTATTPPSGTMGGSEKGSRSASNRGTSSTQFVLTGVTQSSTTKGGATAGTTGSTGATSAMGSIPSTVQLMASGNSSSNWSRYLNHRVEVKGSLMEGMGPEGANPSSTNPSSTNPSSTTPSTNPPTETNPAGNPTSTSPSMSGMNMGSGSMLHVTSIKEVAGTCSGSSR